MIHNDPTGHEACDEDGDCYGAKGWHRAANAPRLSTIETWNWMIWKKFGINMVASSTRSWNCINLRTVYNALNIANNKLNRKLKTMVGGTTFTIMNGGNHYFGLTRSSGIEFHTLNENTKLPIINILHELGHLLDSVPATNDAFSRQIEGIPEWVNDKGFVNRDILLRRFNQPVQALPDEAFDRDEYWADAFANYAADNIDLLDPIGQKMYEFVKLALKKYIYP